MTEPALRVLSYFPLAGIALMAVADVLTGQLNGQVNIVNHTISNLAAGEYGWIADTALCTVALGMVLLAIGLFNSDLGVNAQRRRQWSLTRWRIGCAALVVAAFFVAALAVYNEYGDGDNESGVYHYEFVGMMAGAMTIAMFALAHGLAQPRAWFGWASHALAWLWLATGPWVFLFYGQWWLRLYERGVAVVLVLWLLLAASALRKATRYDF
ncbi:MAG: DUF998 domain-containing protein [Pseudomonadota bacterium]